MAEFKETGVGSRAWYIKTIKANPDRSGFSFIRNENIDGYKLNYPLLKAHMEELTAAGYFQKQGRDDSPRVKYVVTSFGHRYLEQHKDELEDIKPEPVYEKLEGMYYRDKKLISRLMVPKHIADELDGNVNGPVVVKKAAVPVSETPKSDTPEPASIASDTPSIDDEPMTPVFQDTPVRPIDRVVKSAVTLGQEIEKHKAESISEPTPETSPLPEHRSDTPTGPKTDKPTETSPLENTNLSDDIKEKLSEMLLEKFLDKTLKSVMSFDSMSIHDVLAWIEAQEKKA